MKKDIFISCILILLLQACSVPVASEKMSDDAGWKKNVSGQLPFLGHRNWILVVDKAFPAQTAEGIEVVNSGEPLLPVLEYVLQEIGESTHVKPVIYTDHELSFISPAQVPAIDGYRKSQNNLLEGFDKQTILHDSVFVKIDQASRLFKVLVVKTEEVIPYSSVFIELDCSYWSPEQEQELRERMR
jgi:hypothetical protein